MTSFPERSLFVSYSVEPVSQDLSFDFHGLIQEQAIAHASADEACDVGLVDRLYQATQPGGALGAFLIVDPIAARPVTAVTYYDCLTPFGRGVYLEDIVTTASHRRRGLGHMAMGVLAQIAVARGASCLRWECAMSNATAQRFYDDLGGVRLPRQTYRRIDTVLSPSAASENFVLRSLSTQECQSLFPDIPAPERQGAGVDMVGFVPRGGGAPVGGAQLYRSYSTFRGVSGLHVESLAVPDQAPDVAAQMLQALADRFLPHWPGHMDVTLSNETPWLLPALQTGGFEPLQYGDDVMVARALRGAALSDLACAVAHTPHRPRGLANVIHAATTGQSEPTPSLAL